MHPQFMDTRLYVTLLGDLVVPLVSSCRDLINIDCWSLEDAKKMIVQPLGDIALNFNTSL